MKALLFLPLVSLSHAAVLSGTGTHLPLGTGALPDRAIHDVVDSGGSWTGTWANDASADWVGTFSAMGTPFSSGVVATSLYNFSNLPTSTLPTGTFFALSDVDDNSNSLVMRAWDASGSLLSLWLDDTHVTSGIGNGSGGSILPTDNPGWAWDANSSSYSFDGSTVVGNPSVGQFLTNNQQITELEVVKRGTSYNFNLQAPTSVPEPSSVLLSALAGSICLLRRKRSA